MKPLWSVPHITVIKLCLHGKPRDSECFKKKLNKKKKDPHEFIISFWNRISV